MRMNQNLTSSIRTCLFFVVVLVLAWPLHSQDEDSVPAQAEGLPAQSDEITVTARFREENAQEIPGAISVISGEMLETRQVSNARHVKKAVANLTFETNIGSSSNARIFLRGVGTDEPLFTAEPAVAVYVDDVYIARMIGTAFELFDLDRVEVLRGPQGTLYGRNVTGGAVKLYTTRPSGEKSLRFGLTAGDYSELRLQLSAGMGLSERVAANFAVLGKERDGLSTDLTNGRKVNDEDLLAGRFALSFTPRDNLNLVLRGDDSRERSTSGFSASVLVNPDDDLFTLESGIDDLNDLDQSGMSLHLDWTGASFHLTSITAWRRLDHLSFTDSDALEPSLLHLFYDQKQSQLSQELRLASIRGGALEWVAGAFFFTEDNEQPNRFDVFAAVLGPGPTNTLSQDMRSAAIFGQLEYSTGNLQLTGGLRYSFEEKEFGVVSVLPSGDLNFVFNDRADWDHLDYRAELAYQTGERALAYVSVASGYRSGGFNGRGTSPAVLNVFDEEEILAWEVGFKSDLGDRVRLNLHAFFNQYDGLQQSAISPDGAVRTFNVADAEIRGLELEARLQPIERLRIDLLVGTLANEYKELLDPRYDADTLELKHAPDFQWRAAFHYTFLLGERGYLSASADVGFTDDHFQNVANTEFIATRAYTVVNARLAYGPPSGRWELAFLGTNLGDETYFTAGVSVAGLGIGTVFVNKPRWFGGSFSYRF